jgi:hypothetical protein
MRGAAPGRLLIAAVALIVVGTSISAAAAVVPSSKSHSAWPEQNLKGPRTYARQVPRVVHKGLAPYLHAHKASSRLTLTLAFTGTLQAGANNTVERKPGTTHITGRPRAAVLSSKAQPRFAKSADEHGFRVTHLGRPADDSASAKTSTIQRVPTPRSATSSGRDSSTSA